MMEGDGTTMVRIDRQSSIENEPRTLTMDQIQYAREAALCVVNTRSIEEALSIFTQLYVIVGFRAGEECGKTKWGHNDGYE
ncbi:unnamed protein product [Dovyalis caffra]|uniref:Uncharacterized protein n=1 Tax=Dovyalis caffra TaxID=77055 RepID=A0AAV1SMG5_9ROSI|nr:unnamed protein product [Dovyalis caffra]